jgi:hypothetical protein
MAATSPFKEDRTDLDLKLADEDFDVTHSGSGDRFTVKFAIEGTDLLELQNLLRLRLAAVRVQVDPHRDGDVALWCRGRPRGRGVHRT